MSSCSTPLRSLHSKVTRLLASAHPTFDFNEHGNIGSPSTTKNGSNKLSQSSSRNGQNGHTAVKTCQ